MNVSVVTGGSGFVGRHLVRALLSRGDQVTILDIGSKPQGENLAETTFRQTDITDKDAVRDALKGADSVFHVASVVHTKQNKKDFVWDVNLGGTKNVIDACREHDVPKLVYVSSGSVVYEGTDIENGDESLPYASTSQAPYVDSKIQAEKEVLAASSETLATVSLRPHVVFGPEDVRFLPGVVKNAQEGKLRYQVGRGNWLSDFTYVQNLIDAALLADERLSSPNSVVSGKAYFITNGEPMPFWDFVRMLIDRLDLPPIQRSIPHQPVLALAYLREWFDTYVRGGTISPEDGFTPFAIRYMCTHHYFSIEGARKDLGYEPKVSLAEGVELTCSYHLQRNS